MSSGGSVSGVTTSPVWSSWARTAPIARPSVLPAAGLARPAAAAPIASQLTPASAIADQIDAAAAAGRAAGRSVSLHAQAAAALAERLGVPVEDIEERMSRGESLASIARDYGMSRDEAVLVVAYAISGNGELLTKFGVGPLAALAARLVDDPTDRAASA